MYIRKSVCGLCKPHKKVVKNNTKHKRRLEKELSRPNLVLDFYLKIAKIEL